MPYSRRAFGGNIGFVVGCCDWTVQSVANAYLAVALGEFGALACIPASHLTRKLSVSLRLALLAFLNWLGLRTGSRTQELTSLAKALGLLALVVACFTLSPKTAATVPSVVTNLLGQHRSLFLGIVLALQVSSSPTTVGTAPIYFVEEDRDPSTTCRAP